MMKLYELTINGTRDCLVQDPGDLRFSWKLESDKKNVCQKSYHLVIFQNPSALVYDSGLVESDCSVDVRLPDLRLESDRIYTVTVTVQDNQGEEACLSSEFGTALSGSDWAGALWIRPKKPVSGWAPYLRCKFETKAQPIQSAYLTGVALGCGEFYLNGQKTDDGVLDPPATNYEKTILYRKWDVNKLIHEGGNALAVLVGEGFYAQSRIWTMKGFRYGQECAIACLKITYEDGTVQTVVTDPENWKAKLSPYTTNNLYAGETYDCRLETSDFSAYDGDDEGWSSVVVDETPKGQLIGCIMPPIRILRELPCIDVWASSGKNDAAWIFDLGENFAGTYEVQIPPSPIGHVYVFRCAEAINAQGDLDHRSSGGFATQCIQQEIYITRGDPQGEVYRPKLTYHGFRYVEITGINDISQGYGTMPKKEMIKGLQLTTDFAETASFRSSNETLNQLLQIMNNTYRSNFHGYPEDCPAREKCGWLGDAQIVADYGLLTYDSAASYEKYLEDIRTTKEVYGTWQMIAPGKRGCGEATPLWGCAQILIPYVLWKYKGDSSAIEKNIDLMREWMDHEQKDAQDFLISRGLGDWDPIGGNENPGRMSVPHSSTLMYYEIALRMAEISEAFGYGDAESYRNLALKIKDSILRHFYSMEDHSYGYLGSNGVALALGIYPEGEKEALLQSTLALLEKEKESVSTGIYGNKYLVKALLEAGKGEIALDYLLTKEHPSFGTMLEKGATTFWERPDLEFIQPDHKKTVDSYNHPMHGGFLYLCYTKLAGLEPIEPGFKVLRIRPVHLKTLDHLSCSIETPYGKASISYQRAERGFRYELQIPPGCHAIFTGCDGKEHELGSGVWCFIM